MLPSFLIIGGHRFATTWLYTVLRRHARVFCTEPSHVLDPGTTCGAALHQATLVPLQPDRPLTPACSRP